METRLEEINPTANETGIIDRYGEMLALLMPSCYRAKQNRPGKGKDGKKHKTLNGL